MKWKSPGLRQSGSNRNGSNAVTWSGWSSTDSNLNMGGRCRWELNTVDAAAILILVLVGVVDVGVVGMSVDR